MITEEEFAKSYENDFLIVLKALSKTIGDHEQAEEFAQAAFARAWERRAQYTDRGFPFRVWVIRIGWNLYTGAARKNFRSAFSLDEETFGESDNPQSKHEIFPSALDGIDECLDEMSWKDILEYTRPELAYLLDQRYRLQHSNREISAALKIPYGTVSSRIDRAKAELKEILEIIRNPSSKKLPPKVKRRYPLKRIETRVKPMNQTKPNGHKLDCVCKECFALWLDDPAREEEKELQRNVLRLKTTRKPYEIFRDYSIRQDNARIQ